MLANVNLAHDLKMLAPKGRVVVVGSRGRVEIDPRELMAREADVRGVTLFARVADGTAGGPQRHRRRAEGRVAAAGDRAKAFPLEQAAAAHQAIISGGGAQGKIVLTM